MQPNPTTRLCAIDGCERPRHGHGLCKMHCKRKRKTGDPLGTRLPSLAERFWARVLKTDDCWVWQGSLMSPGYGQLTDKKRILGAHRVSWELHHGPIPPGLMVCHTCDLLYPAGDISYRRCVNPNHLFLGIHADNMADGKAKGRLNRGLLNGSTKLTEAGVRGIRAACAAGRVQKDVAHEFGVSQMTVSLIVRRKQWAHVE